MPSSRIPTIPRFAHFDLHQGNRLGPRGGSLAATTRGTATAPASTAQAPTRTRCSLDGVLLAHANIARHAPMAIRAIATSVGPTGVLAFGSNERSFRTP